MDAIRFGTDGWRATLDEFTIPRVRRVGRAVATYLADEGRNGEPVAVGYDARETSPDFADALAEELAAAGHDVFVPERDCPTPLVAFAVVDRDLAGALMVTASHNPPEYNGVKFIPHDGAPAPNAVTDAIEARLDTPAPAADTTGTVHEVDFHRAHAVHVLSLVDADLSGLTVAYDAMHGSGREVTDVLLEDAGVAVHRVRCEADPTFGGTPPEPSAEHLGPLVDAVDRHEADLGIANDGDADRIAVVTPDRGAIDGNLFFAAIYDYLLEAAAGPAVRTVSTTFLIDRIATAHDQSVVEVPVGFKYVAEAMAEHDALVGGEESGGYSIRGHIREKDGVLMALVAAAAVASQSFDTRIDALLETHGRISQAKVSLDCPEERKQPAIATLADRLPDIIAGVSVDRVNDADGFKVLLDDGSWLLMRPSGTEPALRIYAEAESEERVDELLAAGRGLIEPLI